MRGNTQSIYQKILLSRHADSLFTEDEVPSHYTLIKDFNRCMYNQILHCDRKHFCYYCLQSLVAQKYKKKTY